MTEVRNKVMGAQRGYLPRLREARESSWRRGLISLLRESRAESDIGSLHTAVLLNY